MSLAVAWLGLPLVLASLSLGCGLLLERVSDVPLPRALLLPSGFTVIVVASLFTTASSTTAQMTTPLVLALAVAGLALSLPWRPRRIDLWAVAAAVGAYAAFGAPVFMSGAATFAGYITLDDTSSWLGFTDRLLTHGRNLTGLAPSTYEAMLDYYWKQNGYPVGAFPPLGIGHTLLGTDSAWLFQPYIAFLSAMLALGLYGLTKLLIEAPWARALTAFVAAQPALLYGYSLWGGVKEMAASALLVLLAALTPSVLQRGMRARSLLPLATVSAALFGVMNVGGVVWLAPLLLPPMAAGLRLRRVAFVRVAAMFMALAAALSLPSLLLVPGFLNDTSSTLTKQSELGNLIQPLSKLQFFGIWPAGDFRLHPTNSTAAYVLVGVLAAAAVAGLIFAWRQRRWEFLLYVIGASAGSGAAVAAGSPWIAGKALAIASPASVAAGMAGAAWLFRGERRVEAAVIAAAIAGGVLWSNALAYHDVWLAPRGQLAELQQIGERFSGQGPTMMTEDQPYGVRHFLRNMDPEGAAELRRRPILLLNGQELPKGGYADIDQFQLGGILIYRTLVLIHSPAASRPPSVYHLVWSGRYYDVWQRPQSLQQSILEHLPLGGDTQAAAVPPCSAVVRLANTAAASSGRIAAVVRPPATVLALGTASPPPGWETFSGSADVVYPSRSGTLEASVSVPTTGRYGIWLGGSFRGQVEVSIDGRPVGIVGDRPTRLGDYSPFGQANLTAGSHAVAIKYSLSDLAPGTGGSPFPMGPLVLSQHTAELPVTYLQPVDARSLCGKSLDWLEAVTG